MTSKRSAKGPINPVVLTPFHNEMTGLALAAVTAPASAAWGTANLAHFYPCYLADEMGVSKMFWCNGATIGTDSIDMGIYRLTDPVTGRFDLLRSIGATRSAVWASVVQAAGWPQVDIINVTNGNSTSSATTYVTAAVQMAIGKMYILSVENSHAASATAISGVTGGPTFTSRSSTQYNGTLNRTTILTAVPGANYNGTLTIAFSGTTQTGCAWSLEECTGVDTASADGVVQQAVGTGTSVTPLATLAAFGSPYNAAFGAHGHAAATTTTPKTGFIELADQTVASGTVQALETEWRVANDTAVNATITSAAWGSCAIEVKALTRPSPWRIASAAITSGNDSVDRTSYTTASVILKAGKLYLLSVENSKAAAADAVSSIAGGGTWTSRSSVAFNGGTNRVSVWSCVPRVDYSGTIVIDFAAGTETGCCWALTEFVGVDTTTNDGVVQQATGTGNTTIPIVSLAAFGSINNACFFAEGNVASAATPGRGLTELADVTATTPAQYLETAWRADSSPYPFGTITSGQWGACALELKGDTTDPFIPNSEPETPNIYMAFVINGTTATILSVSPALSNLRSAGVMTQASTFPLPSSLTVTGVAPTRVPLAGFSNRSLIG